MYEQNFWDIFGRRNHIQLTMPQILRFSAQIYSARQRNYLWAMSKVKCPRKTTGIFRNVFNIDLISKSGVGVFTRGSACTTAALNKMDSEINTFYRSVASWIGTLHSFSGNFLITLIVLFDFVIYMTFLSLSLYSYLQLLLRQTLKITQCWKWLLHKAVATLRSNNLSN